MNSALMFSKASDEWSTPQDFFDALDAEFSFGLDVAASRQNRKCDLYLGLDQPNPTCRNALTKDWARILGSQVSKQACWMNPAYSRCREFIAKASFEAFRGATVVCLVPSRTDTRWWHEWVWDREKHQPRAGVEIRFIKGRLKFGGSDNSAPFPSVVIIFRPVA